MTATSWWWFALMTEALSFSVQAEIPVVVVLSQRAWPSTWTPTYFEQWDLTFALYPTFGDYNHVLLCPSTIDEAYNFSWLALNIADKYQSIVIVLIDKQMSENFASVDWNFSVPEIDRWKISEIPPTDYKRYELTPDHISSRVDVWTKNWDFIATSYEHDEYWVTTEDSDMKKIMTEKRSKKLDDFFKKEGFTWYEVVNPEANKMIITTSFTSYTAREFVKNNPEFWLIIIKILKPLDDRLLDEIKDKHEVIFVESNYSGQLENYIRKEFCLKSFKDLKISNLRKYDLYPFYYEDFETLLK
jgi:2-oxoglutarate ferredoxin oxidoreductase subunit alpha